MKPLILLLVIILGSFQARSQQAKIRGQLKDTATQQALVNATIILFPVNDSAVKAAASSDKNGAFQLNELPQGDYMLYASYLGYQPVSYAMAINTKDTVIDLGVIPMGKNGFTLREVEIMGKRVPVLVKKDTLEFSAEFFKTRENAVVEELLKKLPGIQVDRDGTIRVHGEIVKKVLVEGRLFFGDDTKMATRNLPAEMIDKVQLIERKSDQAQFTGVDDGKREKAINVTLKKNWKKEFFGQLTAGYGTDERFAVNANLNRIRDKQQLSLLVDGNNINGYQNGKLVDNTNGILRAWNGGINYNDYIGEKLKLSGNYTVNNNRNENQRNTARQNFLQDTTFYYNQQAQLRENTAAHNVKMQIEYNIDTMHMLTIDANANYNTGNNLQVNIYESLGDKQQMINKGTARNSNESNVLNVYNSVTFTKKFRKAGRSLSTSFNFGYNRNDQDGILRSGNIFLQPSGEVDTTGIDQHNEMNNHGHLVQAGLNYSELLFKDHFLLFNYVYTYNYTSSDKFTYDYNPSKRTYDRLNDSLTNSFNSVSSFHFASINLRAQKGKYDYSIGMNALLGDMDNNNISQHNRLQIHNAIFYPMASFNYAFTDSRRMSFNYGAETHQPGVVDMQPVPDNSNPLYIRKGNPDLKMGRTDNFKLEYNVLNAATMRSFSAIVNAGFATNEIINATWFDSLGRQVSQPLNMSGAYTINAAMEHSIPVKKEHAFIKSNTALGFNRDISYINGIRGNVNNHIIGQELSFNYTHQQLFDFTAAANINYNKVSYSVQRENNDEFFNYAFSFNGNINLPLGFTIGSNLDYILNAGRAAGYNLDITMLNAFISKSVFKHKQGIIKLQGFDLLRQNVSIVRNIGNSYIEDVQTRALQRFFILSFSYHLKPKE